jgi:hypothetical protein
MKRRLIALALASCLAVACALPLFAPRVGAHAATATDANTISGVVVNASHQNTIVANQKVTLQRTVGNSAQDIATTVTGQDGRFSFSNVSGTSDDTFAVYTQFQGGLFPSSTVNLGTSDATSLQLKVYDATNDDANLRVTVATMLIRDPRPVNGLIGVAEVVSIENTGTKAFVGTPTGDASKPMRLLRFATPPNASNLSLGLGFSGAQLVTTDKGFGVTATVPPGATDFAFAIDIPYTGTTADFSYKAVYPTARVVTLIPPDMFVNGQDFQAQGIVDSLGTRYQLFTANAKAGQQVSLQLTGLPEAGEKGYLDARAVMILAAILGLLALLILALYLRRGNLAAAVGLIPAKASASAARMELADSADRDVLLREILALERAHKAGNVSDKDFQQQDRALRLRMRATLGHEQAAILSGASVVGAASAESALEAAASVMETSEESAAQEAATEQSSGGRL